MPHIIWEEKYSVNIKMIDEQHKRLFEIFGNIFDRMGKKDDREALGVDVWELARYATGHFDAEELLLSEYYFPGYEQHKKEHEVFRSKVAIFQRDLEKDKTTLSIDIVHFLMSWLSHHILTVDKEYSAFLNEKGIR